MNLDRESLKELLDYDPETGIFRWQTPRQGIRVGDIAGTLHPNGYRRIMINSKFYFEHRLAWIYVHGAWPEDMVDHINGIKDDNRIENLREATRSENEWNQTKRRNNSSGYKGVSWHKSSQKWRATIRANNKVKHLGCFDSSEEAYEVYRKAAKELHGEFANYV